MTDRERAFVARITNGAERMGIALPDGAAERMAAFEAMLREANATMNLTRVSDDPLECADRNYLDSLAPLAFALTDGAKTLCDVGSGAGFPGIPLAIALPSVRVTLMDSLGKRVAFLQRAADALGLSTIAVHTRAEEAARDARFRDAFDIVTARAVARLDTLCELALPFTRPGGRMIAYKGPSLREELEEARPAIAALGGGDERIYTVDLPDRDWSHALLCVQKRVPTPKKYPRKPGEAGRNPIRSAKE